MSIALARPSQTNPLGNLIFPLPGYNGVARRLRQLYRGGQLPYLWRQLFHDEPPQTAEDDLVIDFAIRVNAELFEIDLNYMQELYYSVQENPLDYPIYLCGYRIPWEIACIEEMEPYQQPLAAWLSAWEHDDPMDVWEYFERQGLDAALITQLAPPEKAAVRRSLVARLAEQPEPFNALADLLAAAWELDVQSIFMTYSNLASEEYVPADLFFWRLDNIRYLTEQYHLARPAIARIRAYIDWFDAAQSVGDAYCPHRSTFQVLQEALNAG